ncbi:MAG: response regulator transcription factor [Flavobacteriales bacterium]|nr:response regulator transcription factor [Flavobacteriales bacterium]MBK7940769.1 response regulator transcription factor [Flavobacteriales bacterium]MBK9700813.1 response regulator transcription factor [Flavobacteriales bacterium]
MSPVRILVVDALELVHEGLKARYIDSPVLDLSAYAGTGEAMLERIRLDPPDLVLLDVSLPVMDGIDAMRALHKEHPQVKALAHSLLNGIEYVNSMLLEGASGYVVKNGPREELPQAVRTVMAGGRHLSPAAQEAVDKGYSYTEKRPDGEYVGLTVREREIIRLVALERTNAEIAVALFISEDTVKTHRRNLMTKLNVRSTAGLVRYAVDRCWV